MCGAVLTSWLGYDVLGEAAAAWGVVNVPWTSSEQFVRCKSERFVGECAAKEKVGVAAKVQMLSWNLILLKKLAGWC